MGGGKVVRGQRLNGRARRQLHRSPDSCQVRQRNAPGQGVIQIETERIGGLQGVQLVDQREISLVACHLGGRHAGRPNRRHSRGDLAHARGKIGGQTQVGGQIHERLRAFHVVGLRRRKFRNPELFPFSDEFALVGLHVALVTRPQHRKQDDADDHGDHESNDNLGAAFHSEAAPLNGGLLNSPLKNYGYCCFAQNGPPTRRDEGAYPSWICD